MVLGSGPWGQRTGAWPAGEDVKLLGQEVLTCCVGRETFWQ